MESLLFPDWQAEKWHDPRTRWLIDPKIGFKPGIILGDPQVLLPGEFDERWHMFLIGRGHFFRLDSDDGLEWSLVYDNMWDSGPTCVTSDGEKWIVYYSKHDWANHKPDSVIVARTSTDLTNWSEPRTVLEPTLAWEKEGPVVQIRNPNLVRLGDNHFRLYYCGGTNWMGDMNFEEPKYIGCADADNPFGPFRKVESPIIRPDHTKWYRNFGSGAIKVFRYGKLFLGMVNGVYLDKELHSRSAIGVMLSKDGIAWTDAPYNPIVAPSDGPPRKTLVYQLDLRHYQGGLWLYYNAREGWAKASEGICLANLQWNGPVPEKLWRLPLNKR